MKLLAAICGMSYCLIGLAQLLNGMDAHHASIMALLCAILYRTYKWEKA